MSFCQPLTKSNGLAPESLLALLGVTIFYLAVGIWALAIYPLGNDMAGIWPAAGVAVAAVLILGPWAAVAVWAGDFVFSLYAGWPPLPALVLALGSVAEALAAWLLLVRLMPIGCKLKRTRDVALFVVFGVLPSAFLCVALRLGLLSILGNEQALDAEFVSRMAIGFVGHSLGILVIAPVFMTWNAEPTLPRRQLEFGFLLLASLVFNLIGFTVTVAAPGSAFLYPIFVAVLWAALRFGPRETSLVIALTGVFATWAAGSGSGPFLLSNQNEALISLSLFLVVATATALFLGAAASERDLYLQRVIDSEHAQRTLIDQMAEGVVTFSPDGRLRFASERFCQLCSRPIAELIGLRIQELFPDAKPGWRELQGDTGDVTVEIEASMLVPDREKRSLMISLRRMTNAEGHPQGTLAVVADITERRQAEEQAQQHLRQLAHMGRVKSLDEMAVAFAHEVAQPLTAAMTYTQAAQRLMLGNVTLPGRFREALDGAAAQTRRASAIVARIRAFAQDRPWQPTNLSVQELLRETARFAEPEARQHSARLLVSPGCPRCRVLADELQLQQVLINLVRNAAEAMSEQAEETREIRLTACSFGDGRLDLTVSDTGPGVKPEQQSSIFDAFFTTKQSGIGIGLALCRSIIEAHGGEFFLESPTTGGAIFHIILREVTQDEFANT